MGALGDLGIVAGDGARDDDIGKHETSLASSPWAFNIMGTII
jgi:hypothetical protein